MKDNLPLVSVIVPVYNVERYLEKCVDSILSQTYKNIELILVDDGSTDKSSAICDEYEKRDPRVKVRHKQNGGQADARNQGIGMATGEYIGFIDSDDSAHPEMYEKLYRALSEQGADLCLCDYKYVDDNGADYYRKNPITRGTFTGTEIMAKLQEPAPSVYITPVNRLYKREIFDGLEFPVGKINEDAGIAYLVYDRAEKVVTIEDKLYYYLQRRGSTMHTRSVRSYDGVEMIYNRIKFYEAKGLLSYIPSACELLFKRYMSLFGTVKAKNEKEKKRVREIEGMVAEVYKTYYPERSVSKALRYCHPRIYGIIKWWSAKAKLASIALKALRIALASRLSDICYIEVAEDRAGDAEYKLLKAQLKTCACKLRAKETEIFKKRLSRLISPKCQIIVQGGGALGIPSPKEEECVRTIIEAFKNRKVTVLPKTVCFDMSSEQDRAYFEESKRIYSRGKSLTVFVSDEQSHSFIQENMPEIRCILAPDTAAALEALRAEM